MCEQCAPAGGWTRRQLLLAGPAIAGGAALAGLIGGNAAPAGATVARARTVTVTSPSGLSLDVIPRSTWGANLPPKGTIQAESDVRFLLVHHTVSSNDYAADQVAGIIGGFYNFHTGPDKGWPDVAYNFLVDRFGRIWEARAGSVAGAVQGDATGGNQGFDQKCCFIGDHTAQAPSSDAQSAMVRLLSWLADRHGIATEPGSITTFTSRGSNRHATGTAVTTATIEGHRSMSRTACPGDAAYTLVKNSFPERATTWRASGGTATTAAHTTTTTAPPATTSPTTGTTSSSTASTTTPTSTSSTPTTTEATPKATGPDSTGLAIADPDSGNGDGLLLPAVGAGIAGTLGVGALAALARRRAEVARSED